MTPQSLAIKIEHVTKTYHMGMVAVHALDDISLEIPTGCMACIIGKSGSGKSTLLRQLSLIDKPTKGSIYIHNKEVTKLSEYKRSAMRLSRLGYVFQEYALLAELTALENVYLPAMMLGKSAAQYKKQATELLDLVGLEPHAKHRPKELSGGEQQRVAIARALINQPQIIYADEPTANLDSLSARTVMETLVRLNEELRVTILFVSHDPDDKKYAQRLIYLKDGKLSKEEK